MMKKQPILIHEKIKQYDELNFYDIKLLLELLDNNYEALALYMLLNERYKISYKNNSFIDKYRRVFIYFTREEARQILKKNYNNIIKLFDFLKKRGLIFEINQGLNKPKKIYLLTLINNPKVKNYIDKKRRIILSAEELAILSTLK